MIAKLRDLHWPAVAVLAVFAVCMTAILLAPEKLLDPDVKKMILGPGGVASLIVAWRMPATKSEAARRSLPPPPLP